MHANESTKLQHPSTGEIPNLKHQTKTGGTDGGRLFEI
jgi:hypothetical protein